MQPGGVCCDVCACPIGTTAEYQASRAAHYSYKHICPLACVIHALCFCLFVLTDVMDECLHLFGATRAANSALASINSVCTLYILYIVYNGVITYI